MQALDYAVVAFYGAAVVWLGTRVARDHHDAKDLWLGGRALPVWAVLCSMVATELSAATFIGVPEAAFAGDWSYMEFAFGALTGKAILAATLIPLYHRLDVITVYGLLEQRFGPRSRRVAALCFVGGRILASGVRLFVAALAFSLVAGVGVVPTIVLFGALAGAYTLYGGIRSVIYTDVLQGAVFLVAAMAVLVALLVQVPGGFAGVVEWAAPAERMRIFTFDPWISLSDTRPFLVGWIGGTVLTLATHGTDHDMVQRLLTTRTGREGGRALLGSALLNFPLTALFLFIGSAIACVHESGAGLELASSTQALPAYAMQQLPSGLRGLLFAGIAAAAMSSFDSAVCAISTTWVVDVRRIEPGDDAAGRALRRTRWSSLGVCGLLVAAAIGISAYHSAMIEGVPSQARPQFNLVALALSAMTVLYGGLLGVFLVAGFGRTRGSDTSVPWALGVGGGVGLMLFLHPLLLGATWIAWPWWIPLSASIAASVAVMAPSAGARPAG